MPRTKIGIIGCGNISGAYCGAGKNFPNLEVVGLWTHAEIAGQLDRAASGAGLNRTKGWQPVRAAVTGSTCFRSSETVRR